MKVGEKAKVSPQLTGEPDWVEGEVIDIEQNPFKGIEEVRILQHRGERISVCEQ